jgi:mannosyltransferase OCH1-like enzyme
MKEYKIIQKETIRLNEAIERPTFSSKMKPFPLKKEYRSVVPLKIFTTWHTKHLPPKMQENWDALKSENPEFEHYLYDDFDCQKFIKDHFPQKVLDSYLKLVPQAYKSDLWRYCVLYIYGGIYLDIKLQTVNGFKLIHLTEKEHWVLDTNPKDVCVGLLISKPDNEIFRKCINQIVENCENNYYGRGPLDPTGPALLGSFFSEEEKKKMQIQLRIIDWEKPNWLSLRKHFHQFVLSRLSR